jgi:hypothetical protein
VSHIDEAIDSVAVRDVDHEVGEPARPVVSPGIEWRRAAGSRRHDGQHVEAAVGEERPDLRELPTARRVQARPEEERATAGLAPLSDYCPIGCHTVLSSR